MLVENNSQLKTVVIFGTFFILFFWYIFYSFFFKAIFGFCMILIKLMLIFA